MKIKRLRELITTKIYLLIVLIVLLIILANAAIVENDYVLVELKYENGIFSLINKGLEKGSYPNPAHNSGKEYNINLLSDDKSVLYTLDFDPTLLFTDGTKNNEIYGGIIVLNETNFVLTIPSYEEGEKVEILKDNEKVFETDVYNIGAKNCRIK